MKKVLSLLAILIIAFSCSSDDSEKHSQYQFPTNLTVDLQSAQVGDILTISGNGFSTSETYIVTFSENQIATITEKGNNYLKVEVPENAVSGNITLTFNRETNIVGAITIVNQNTTAYAIKHSSLNSMLLTIDPDSGDETTTLDFGSTDFLESLTVDQQTGIIYAMANIGDENSENKLYIINTNSGTFSTTTLNNDINISYEIALVDSDNLYAIKHSSMNSMLLTIDPDSGDETVILDLGSTDFLESLTVDQQTGTIYAMANIGDGNNENKLYIINTNSGTFSTTTLNNDINISYEIALVDSDNLYAIKHSPMNSMLLTIDPDSGDETVILDLGSTDFLESLTVDQQTGTIYAMANIGDGNNENKLYIINTNSRTFSTTTLNNDINVSYEIQIVYD